MSSPPHRARLVVIVGNGITGDSRVQKTAIAAARDGWEVTLVGIGGTRRTRTAMGPVEVIRVPIGAHMRERGKGHRIRRIATQFGIADKNALARLKARHEVWVRRTTARMGWMRTGRGRPAVLATLGRPASRALGAVVRVRREVHRLRVRAFGWEQRHKSPPTGDWRKDLPHLLDLDLALGPVIEELRPDLIHANDITMLPPVAQSVARMRARGQAVAWLYDAHEYVRGFAWPLPEQMAGYPAVERDLIRLADAVVTVSPQIAERLQREYRLARLPLVVRNGPVRAMVGAGQSPPSVRQACGLAGETPLMVYAGWLSPERGVATAVTSLPKLAGVHLAVVVGRASAELDSLLQRAEQLGVRERVHVVPYVPPHAVPDYLSSADLGLICTQRMLNYEISLPTKLAEYLYAGLPVVASDIATVREFVQRHGVGEVFPADDCDAFADAVNRAMAHRAGLAANITEAILENLSWERQSAELLRLYREISPVPPGPARPDVAWDVPEGAAALDTAEAIPLRTWRRLDSTPVRLGLGPANYAGQAAAFAQAICRDNPDVSAEVFMRMAPGGYAFPADVYLEVARQRDLDAQIEQLQRVIGRYSHLVADAFLPVFGYLNGDTIEADLPALRRAGIKVALLAHGSEVRHPGRHLQRHEFSLFHDAPEGVVQRYTVRAERNRRIAEESGLPLFVTTPDLLEDLPWGTWAPLVVDVAAWSCDEPVMRRRRPVVLHAPSQRWTKGTDRILPILQDLHERDEIELQLAEKLTWEQVRDMVKGADVVVDQFTTGSYGTFAVEAMAAGRPVVAYLSDSVEQRIGTRPPIVNATPATLRDGLRSLLADRARAAQLGSESVAYTREFHDGRRTAHAFDDFLR